jgi:hypothetical protein
VRERAREGGRRGREREREGGREGEKGEEEVKKGSRKNKYRQTDKPHPL